MRGGGGEGGEGAHLSLLEVSSDPVDADTLHDGGPRQSLHALALSLHEVKEGRAAAVGEEAFDTGPHVLEED